MDRIEWTERYADHLIEKYGFIPKEAEEMAEAGAKLYWETGYYTRDFPEDAADDEMDLLDK